MTLLMLSSASFAVQPLPTNGVIASGSGSISKSGAAMSITQNTAAMSIDWDSFSIGNNNQVTFVQPSSSSVSINRITGGQASSILGRLNANGRVFLVNPSGITFGAGARVNVGSLVASTLNVNQRGLDYVFEGASTAGISNAGVITATTGGTLGLIAARIENTGKLIAPQGTVALGAGSQVRLSLGGLVSLDVEQGAVDALIEQGGAIRADGGLIYLGAKAVGDITQTVINHTGVTRAQTLATGQNGEIYLMGDMGHGQINVAGVLDASAPKDGDGGFIETSAAQVNLTEETKVTTLASQGQTGQWLIDPQDYTIAASGGDITGSLLSSNLGSSNIIIQSIAGATDNGTAGDINVNDTVTWSANKLTLNAQGDINVNANLNGSGTASLAFEYGQSSSDGGTATYNVRAPINLPAGPNFSTQKGSTGSIIDYTVFTALGSQGSTTGSDLQGMNGNLSGNYALGADVDASSTSTWNAGAGFDPIGDSSTRFTGIFDGLGHVITELTINRPTENYVGLFGYFEGSTISNIGLNGGSVIGKNFVGGLVGRGVNSTISKSYVTGNVTGDGGFIGAMAGMFEREINQIGIIGITNSYASADVMGGAYVGGLVGLSTADITNSYATGAVAGQQASSANLGGLAGYVDLEVMNLWGTGITDSFWDTETTGQGSSAGGGSGLTTSNMQRASSFSSSWDISARGGESTVWRIYEGQTAPLLRTFMQDVIVSGPTRAYDGTSSVDLSAASFSETVTGITLTSGQFSTANVGATIVGASYSATASESVPAVLQRYDFQITGAITPKALTATAVAADKVYDGNPTASSVLTLSGLIASETLTTSGVASTFNDKDVLDANTVTVTAATLVDGSNGGLASNYSLATGQTVAAAITAKALTVIVDDNHSMTQGGSVPNLTYAIAGASLVNDDTLTGALTTVATSSSSAGTYGITQGTLTNEQNPNYSITFGADNLIILPTVIRAPVMVATLLPRSKAFNAPLSSSEEEEDAEDDSSALK
jgi:filamentous hemagglutinin family protein